MPIVLDDEMILLPPSLRRKRYYPTGDRVIEIETRTDRFDDRRSSRDFDDRRLSRDFDDRQSVRDFDERRSVRDLDERRSVRELDDRTQYPRSNYDDSFSVRSGETIEIPRNAPTIIQSSRGPPTIVERLPPHHHHGEVELIREREREYIIEPSRPRRARRARSVDRYSEYSDNESYHHEDGRRYRHTPSSTLVRPQHAHNHAPRRRSPSSHRNRNIAAGVATLATTGLAAHQYRKHRNRSRSRSCSSCSSRSSSAESSHKLRNTAALAGAGLAAKKLYDHHQRKQEDERYGGGGSVRYHSPPRHRSQSRARQLAQGAAVLGTAAAAKNLYSRRRSRSRSSSSERSNHTGRHIAAAVAGATAAGVAAHKYQQRSRRGSYSSSDSGRSRSRSRHRGRKVAGLAAAGLVARKLAKSQSRPRNRSRSSSVESGRSRVGTGSRMGGSRMGGARSRSRPAAERVQGMARDAALSMAGSMMEKRARARSVDGYNGRAGRRRGSMGGGAGPGGQGRDIAYKIGEAVAGMTGNQGGRQREMERERRY